MQKMRHFCTYFFKIPSVTNIWTFMYAFVFGLIICLLLFRPNRIFYRLEADPYICPTVTQYRISVVFCVPLPNWSSSDLFSCTICMAVWMMSSKPWGETFSVKPGVVSRDSIYPTLDGTALNSRNPAEYIKPPKMWPSYIGPRLVWFW